MSKVFPLQDMHVGAPNGGVFLRTTKGYEHTDPFVVAHPHLFTDPEPDARDKEIEDLKAQLAALKPTAKKAGA
jgi:hypothetical protein